MRIQISLFIVISNCFLTAHASAQEIISYYDFDSTSQFADQGARNNDGTAFGNASVTTAVDEFKLGDGALKLDGVGDFLSINGLLDDISTGTNFSVTTWFRTPSSGNRAVIFSANGPATDNVYLAGLDGSGRAASHVGPGITGHGVSGLDDDNYHFLAVTYNATTNSHTVRVDNMLQTGFPDALVDWDNATSVQIGMERDNGSPSDYWNGFIDDLAIFEGELTESQIGRLWNNGVGRVASDFATVPEPSSLPMLLIVLGAAMRRHRGP